MKRKYLVMMDARDKDLVEEAIEENLDGMRGDGSDCLADAIARLESISFTPVESDTTTLPLAAQLMQASHDMTTSMQQQVIESLQRDVNRMEAELSLIRGDIDNLFHQDWMPTPGAIVAALYPDSEAITQRMRTIRN